MHRRQLCHKQQKGFRQRDGKNASLQHKKKQDVLSRLIQNEERRYQFHKLLDQADPSQVLAFAKKIRVKGLTWRDLKCDTWKITSSCFVSPFHAWVWCWRADSRIRDVKELFFVLKEAGGILRESNPRVLRDLMDHRPALEFVWEHAPHVINIHARVTIDNGTMLMCLLDRPPRPFFANVGRCWTDEFAAKCIDRLTIDESFELNVANNHGWCALSVAVCNYYFKSLDALLRRIPALSIEPEMDGLSISLNEAMKQGQIANSGLSISEHSKMKEMIDNARKQLEIYRVSLGPMLCKTLYSIPIEVCAIIRSYVDRSPH